MLYARKKKSVTGNQTKKIGRLVAVIIANHFVFGIDLLFFNNAESNMRKVQANRQASE
jgi:hypothetical protein